MRDGGFSMPTTVAELADILAQLGVFESTQTSNGPTIWRAPEDLSAPATVPQLPEDWLAHEDRVHWTTDGGTDRRPIPVNRSANNSSGNNRSRSRARNR